MKTVNFGVVGCGLMGREFASAAARWCHLVEPGITPRIVAVCDPSEAARQWFIEKVPSVGQVTSDYRELLTNPEVEAVYVAVPHNLHGDIYCATLAAGKHLMGEKPFGIDFEANRRVNEEIAAHPHLLVRCSSESPFFPAVQRIGKMLTAGAFGTIIEADTGFLHSSDLNPDKPINWKRIAAFNGEYGVMGDLGMHACHLGFRAGWRPLNVRAVLNDIIRERPDGQGGRVPCDTWDNATLLCEASAPGQAASFPWTIKMHRIAPGEKNNWYLTILGTKASARWSSVYPDTLEVLRIEDGEQAWCRIQTGHETAYPVITGGIFQFGFPDSILQMWAAFMYELLHGQAVAPFAGCVTPNEAALSHRLFTAALRSQCESGVVVV